METFSRHVLAALVCGVAGPIAALVAFVVTAAPVLGAAVGRPEGIVETVGSLMLGSMVAALVAGAVAVLVAAGATLVALRLTGCPRPTVAWATCLVLALPWSWVVDGWATSVTAYLVLMGLLPAGVRLVFATAGEARAGRTA